MPAKAPTTARANRTRGTGLARAVGPEASLGSIRRLPGHFGHAGAQPAGEDDDSHDAPVSRDEEPSTFTAVYPSPAGADASRLATPRAHPSERDHRAQGW